MVPVTGSILVADSRSGYMLMGSNASSRIRAAEKAEKKNHAKQRKTKKIFFDSVKKFRLESKAESTRNFSKRPHRFAQVSYQERPGIIIPKTSSERRKYIPMGFVDKDTVVSDLAFVIYDAKPYVLGIISSTMHMAWIRSVCGRLKTDYRYSASICYNNFPIPVLTVDQEIELSALTMKVLGIRECYPNKSLAHLYDPDSMPQDLQFAHSKLDIAVDRIYRPASFECEEERLSILFNL